MKIKAQANAVKIELYTVKLDRRQKRKMNASGEDNSCDAIYKVSLEIAKNSHRADILQDVTAGGATDIITQSQQNDVPKEIVDAIDEMVATNNAMVTTAIHALPGEKEMTYTAISKQNTFDKIQDWVSRKITAFIEWATKNAIAANNWIQGEIGKVLTMLEHMWIKMTDIAERVLAYLGNKGMQFVRFVKDMIEWLRDFGPSFIETLKDFLDNVLNKSVYRSLQRSIEICQVAVNSIGREILPMIKNVVFVTGSNKIRNISENITAISECSKLLWMAANQTNIRETRVSNIINKRRENLEEKIHDLEKVHDDEEN